MKKLELKETPAPKIERKRVGTKILSEVRESLKLQIKVRVIDLYHKAHGENPNFAEGEEWFIRAKEPFRIFIPYFDTYLLDSEKAFESIEVHEIIVTLDGIVIVHDKLGNEWDDMELSVEALAEIANRVDAWNEEL